MKDLDHNRFILIFWYIVGCTMSGLLYVFMITFLTVPKESIRFADTSLGFFLGTLITSCLFYLTGGNPSIPKKKLSEPGSITVEPPATITATTSNSDTKESKNDTDNV